MEVCAESWCHMYHEPICGSGLPLYVNWFGFMKLVKLPSGKGLNSIAGMQTSSAVPFTPPPMEARAALVNEPRRPLNVGLSSLTLPHGSRAWKASAHLTHKPLLWTKRSTSKNTAARRPFTNNTIARKCHLWFENQASSWRILQLKSQIF